MNLKNIILNKRSQMQKGICYGCIYMNGRTGKTKWWWWKSEQCFFFWVGGWNQLEKSRRELPSGKILYLDWSGSYMDAHICQNSLNGTLVSMFYYM